ncbi:MAG: transposase [Nanoarchaeota archaeon]
MDEQRPLGDYGEDFWFKSKKDEREDIQTTLPNKKLRKKYIQNWSAYNFSKCHEKIFFMKILCSIIDSLNIEYEYAGNGRPSVPMQDKIKSCLIKVYSKSASRNIISDLKLFQGLGYLKYAPSFRLIDYFMESEKLTHHLSELIRLTAEPLKQLESHVSIDSTGFSTFNRKNWIDIRFDKLFNKLKKDYKKLHIVTGVKTNVVISAKVTKGTANDCPEFEDLIKKSVYFDIKEVSGDPAYLSRKNCDIVASIRATPFILPKKNTIMKANGSPAWFNMIKFFKEHENEFMKKYHLRSNVESTFAMLKRNYLPYVKAKSDKGQENEVLCKVVCHNIACLITSMFEYGIKIKFID